MGLFRRARASIPQDIGPSTIDPFVAQFHRALTTAFDPGLAGLWNPNAAPVERVGVAMRCLQLVSQNVASLRLRYRRRQGRDSAAPDPMWLYSPDPNWFPNGLRDALFAVTWSVFRDGDAFVYVTSRYADGFPATWTVLNAQAVEVEAVGGRRRFSGGGVELVADDVLQISRNPTGALRGTGALEAYAANVQAAYSADRFASTVFSGSGIPAAILQSSRRLSADQAADVQTQWMARGAEVPGAPRVLPPELQFIAQSFSPKDLTLLESRQWDASQIAGAFGVPAPLLNLPLPSSGLTYTNTASLAEFWWRFELLPGPAEAIQTALSTFVPSGNWVEFDASRYLRPDLPTLVGTLSTLLTDGIISPEEYRAMLDLPPAETPIRDFDEPAGSGSPVTSIRAVPAELEVVQQ